MICTACSEDRHEACRRRRPLRGAEKALVGAVYGPDVTGCCCVGGWTLCVHHARQIVRDDQPPTGPCQPAATWLGGWGDRMICDVEVMREASHSDTAEPVENPTYSDESRTP